MTYVAHITVPVVFQANSDAEARNVLTMMRTHLADVSFSPNVPDEYGWEISDYPDAELQEVLPYETPRPVSLDATTPPCSAVASSGNDCDLTPTGVLTTADDSHRVYTCETHRNRLTVEFADAEGSFCYTILPTPQ